jgi:hypothetical protein
MPASPAAAPSVKEEALVFPAAVEAAAASPVKLASDPLSAEAAPAGEAEGAAESRWGHWFRFDDSTVSAVPLAALSASFEGKQCAYMLLYRSRVLGPIADSGPDHAASHHERSSGAQPIFKCTPPPYWVSWVARRNAELAAARAKYEHANHAADVVVYCPAHLSRRGPHLVPLSDLAAASFPADAAAADASAAAAALAVLPLIEPLKLEADLSQGPRALAALVEQRVGSHAAAMGVAPPGAWRAGGLKLHRLERHGPGFVVGAEYASASDPPPACLLAWDGQRIHGALFTPAAAPPLTLLVTTLAPGEPLEKADGRLVVRKRVGQKSNGKPTPVMHVSDSRRPLYISRSATHDDVVASIASLSQVAPPRAPRT